MFGTEAIRRDPSPALLPNQTNQNNPVCAAPKTLPNLHVQEQGSP
jgi:hypothetical protein